MQTTPERWEQVLNKIIAMVHTQVDSTSAKFSSRRSANFQPTNQMIRSI